MKNIGLQFWSIREIAAGDLLSAIEKVAAMGYTGVQFAGFSDHEAIDVKVKMEEVGIRPAGAHVQLEQLENQLEETLAFHETIGNKLLIVPYISENRRSSKEDYKKVAEVLNDIGEKLSNRGFNLAYHNHDFEFESFDGETGLEIICKHTHPDYLKIELDCFWAHDAGHDPIEIIEKYADRIVSLHIKDMKIQDGQPISTEIGTGTLPLTTYIEKGQENEVDWLIIEQEHFSKDPLTSAEENINQLKELVGELL